MDPQLLVFPAIIAFAALLAWVFWKVEQARRARWAAVAARHGLTYSHRKDRGLAQGFNFLDRLRKGRNRYAVDVLQGARHGRPVVAFTHHHETTRGSGDNESTRHHWHAVIAVHLSDRHAFPELEIRPEGALSRLGNLFTNRDIDFESIEFSRAYQVHCRDRRFAYDVCHPPMMEYLLAARGTVLELEGPWLATIEEGKLRSEDIDRRLHHLDGIAGRLPDHLFRS